MNRHTTIASTAVAAIVLVASFKAFKTPVPVRGPAAGLYERIDLSVQAALSRNTQAAQLCETDVNAVLSREFAEIARAGNLAAAEVSTLSSCGTIITMLAREQLGGTTRTTDFIEDQIQQRLDPALTHCGRELKAALDRYETSLRRSTVTLAAELAQSSPGGSAAAIPVTVDVTTAEDLDQALLNLGLSGGVLTVATVFDTAAILKTRLLQNLLRKLGMLAASAFAKPAAAAAGSAAVAAADGPLPIGDLLAIAGGIWTGYEIYATRAGFERDVKHSIANALPDMKRNVHRQLMERIGGLQADYQQAQDEIRNQIVESLQKGN